MKLLKLALCLGLLVAFSVDTSASPKKKTIKPASRTHTRAAAKKTQSDLKTDVSFDDSVLHGQYQTPDEALARVENEKGFGDLVGVRKHFKDRLQRASEQE